MSRLGNIIFQLTHSPQFLKSTQSSYVTKICCSCYSSDSKSSKETKIAKSERQSRSGGEKFIAPSPFKNPGPRRYGFKANFMTRGTLPRDGKEVKSLPPYQAADNWDKKSAVFGQNDYIDILGDGDLHPSDLLTGPPWLIAFKGNERERLMRKMEWQGNRTRTLYPAEYNRMEKRIRYLTKIYNTRRHMKHKD